MRKKNASIGLYHHAIRNNDANENRPIIEGGGILAEGGIVTIVKLLRQGYHYIKL